LLELLKNGKPPSAKGWYNGFSPKERTAKLTALNKLIRTGEVPPASGPCDLCGETNAKVEYHGENYAAPYQWTPPAVFVVCRACHRCRIHRRFDNPQRWNQFVEHVYAGGTASSFRYGTSPAPPAARYGRGEDALPETSAEPPPP
jgi:hypothetical protein